MEKDIKFLKSQHKITSTLIKSRQNSPFIPNLIEPKYLLPENIEDFSTEELLSFLERLFQNPVKYKEALLNLAKILVVRPDFFISFVSMKNTGDDLYNWVPGSEDHDFYSFVCKLIQSPEMLFNYNEQFFLLTQKSGKNGIMLKDIKMDHKINFRGPKKDFGGNYSVVEISEPSCVESILISHPYWTEATCERFCLFEADQPNHPEKEFSLCSCYSMADIEIKGTIKSVKLIVTIKALEELLLKNGKSKEYWMRLGIIDDDWNFVI